MQWIWLHGCVRVHARQVARTGTGCGRSTIYRERKKSDLNHTQKKKPFGKNVTTSPVLWTVVKRFTRAPQLAERTAGKPLQQLMLTCWPLHHSDQRKNRWRVVSSLPQFKSTFDKWWKILWGAILGIRWQPWNASAFIVAFFLCAANMRSRTLATLNTIADVCARASERQRGVNMLQTGPMAFVNIIVIATRRRFAVSIDRQLTALTKWPQGLGPLSFFLSFFPKGQSNFQLNRTSVAKLVFLALANTLHLTR